MENYPLYAEAMNEKGLCMAGLYFPENARYFPEQANKTNITPYELIPYLLGQYESVQEMKTVIEQISLLDISFNAKIPLTPLHWIIADQKESLILQSTQSGLQVYQDAFHILTNNPPYPYHQWNVHNYMHLTSSYPQDHLTSQSLKPYGNGFGTIGIPGDFSPASRFVKTLWLKENVMIKCVLFKTHFTSAVQIVLSYFRCCRNGQRFSKNNAKSRRLYGLFLLYEHE